MGSRGSRLRTKIVALLVSLTALWAFAAWVTLRDGLNLLWVQTLNVDVYEPSEPLLLGLQVERRMSMAQLGSATGAKPTGVATQRQKVDGYAADFRESVRGRLVGLAADEALQKRVDELVDRIDKLPQLRTAIDDRTIDRLAAADVFNDIVDSVFQVYSALGQLDDPQIAADTTTLTELNRARELMARADALLTGALAAGRFTDAEYVQFTQFVGNHRLVADTAAGKLPDGDRARYDAMLAGEASTALRAAEYKIIAEGRPGLRLQVGAETWRKTADDSQAALLDVVLTGGSALVDRATPVAVWVVIRVLLAAGLGLLTVIASIVVAITTARTLLKQLERLREAARHLANERLPDVVDRLSRGETVDVAAEAPPLEFGSDEIGQVGQTFNAVQETAVRVAVEQAELRRGVRDIFLNLARRTQALVHRQLTLLDEMERRHDNAAQLDDLFRLDHLATRMRRNAENLIVLSGATPGRAWRRTVPMVDVVRGAVAEVEDYTRVTVLPTGDFGLAGRAVSDVIHLLAELIENALSFSPPHTEVQVKSQLVANGYVIEIEDRGLGMTPDELTEANALIANPREFNLSAVRLGLFVVSRLAERHHMRVQLRESPYGGTTAIVLIPRELVSELPADPVPVAVGAGAQGPAGSTPVLPTRGTGPTKGTGATSPATAPARRAARQPALPPAPPAAEPLAEPDGQPPVHRQTPTGLPVRHRQASLPVPPPDGAPPAAEPPGTGERPRPPEQIRSRIASYQAGTRRARAASPRAPAAGDEAPAAGDEAPAAGDDPPAAGDAK